MGLRDVLRDVHHREKALVVYNPDDPLLVDELADYLSDRPVTVRRERTATGRPENVAAIEVDGDAVTVVQVETLRELLETVPRAEGEVGVDDRRFRHVLRHLESETFTSTSSRRLLATTREIEDRAYRVGGGALRVGFQNAANLRAERERYAALARRGLTVTTWIAPGTDVPSVPGVAVRAVDHPDVRECWFVAYASTDARQGCALLAHERAPDSYDGFWTYDPDVLERLWVEIDELGERASL